MTDTIIQQTRTEPSGVAKLVKVFQNPSDRIEFEDNYIHYVHAAALEGLTRLDVRGLKNAQIHFLGKMKGNQVYEGSYRADSGVVNFVDCDDVLVGGLSVMNERVFSPGNLITESSCAVNVQESRMRFERCRFDSLGKICLSVHSDSYVELDDVMLVGYYFELLVGASEVVGSNLQIFQDHPDPDSHSAIWTGSSIHQAITNKLFKNSKIRITDSVFDMASGRSMVSGNGSYDSRSEVEFERCSFTPARDATFGICTYHETFNSLTVKTDFLTHDPLTGLPIDDFISTPAEGFARFVDYYEETTRPGRGQYSNPDQPAPLLVDDINSDDVWATLA